MPSTFFFYCCCLFYLALSLYYYFKHFKSNHKLSNVTVLLVNFFKDVNITSIVFCIFFKVFSVGFYYAFVTFYFTEVRDHLCDSSYLIQMCVIRLSFIDRGFCPVL